MRRPWCAARWRCAATSRTAPGSAPAGPRSTRSKPWASPPSSACCARRMGSTRTAARSFTWGCWQRRQAPVQRSTLPPRLHPWARSCAAAGAQTLLPIAARRRSMTAARRRSMTTTRRRSTAAARRRPMATALPPSTPPAPPRPPATAPPPAPADRASARAGVVGAQAQAAAGFPSVYRVALPASRAALARSAAPNQARVQAFFALLGHLDDTNLLHRGGREGLAYARLQATRFLADGGVFQARWQRRATDLHLAFRERWLSPGGSADLLAVCLFVHAAEG